MSRTFIIPNTTDTESVSITLHEPSLTADNLGHKTWLASFLLAKRLPSLVLHLPPLGRSIKDAKPSLSPNNRDPNIRVIELGAGTGLVGLAFAALFPVHVHLTDLPDIVPNLQSNVTANESNPSTKFRGTTSVGEFDWSDLPSHQNGVHTAGYNIVLAADPLYTPQHPAWLVEAIEFVLKKDTEARVVIELPLRDAYASEVDEFKSRMKALGLEIDVEGVESGFEDWESAQYLNGKPEVMCWWAVWRWSSLG